MIFLKEFKNLIWRTGLSHTWKVASSLNSSRTLQHFQVRSLSRAREAFTSLRVDISFRKPAISLHGRQYRVTAIVLLWVLFQHWGQSLIKSTFWGLKTPWIQLHIYWFRLISIHVIAFHISSPAFSMHLLAVGLHLSLNLGKLLLRIVSDIVHLHCPCFNLEFLFCVGAWYHDIRVEGWSVEITFLCACNSWMIQIDASSITILNICVICRGKGYLLIVGVLSVLIVLILLASSSSYLRLIITR